MKRKLDFAGTEEWINYLSDSDYETMLSELEQFFIEWKATALIYADPKLLKTLTGSLLEHAEEIAALQAAGEEHFVGPMSADETLKRIKAKPGMQEAVDKIKSEME